MNRLPLAHFAQSFLAVAVASVAVGCAAPTEDVESDEGEIAASLYGRFETSASATARMKPGYLYRIELSPGSIGYRYATVLVVSNECGKGGDGTCDRAWIDSHANSLDRYWNNVIISTSKKTLTLSYEVPQESGDPEEVTRKWSYAAKSGGLQLTESVPNARPFFVSRIAKRPLDAATKAAFESWIENDLAEDSGLLDNAPSVANNALPLAAQREVHYYDREWADYGTSTTRVTVAGTDYYALSQQNDGGGKYIFFTLDGREIGDFGGSESGEWGFDAAQY